MNRIVYCMFIRSWMNFCVLISRKEMCLDKRKHSSIKRITISYKNSSFLIVPLHFLYTLMKQVCVGIQNYERSSISFIILFVSLLQFPLWSKVTVLVVLISHIKNNIRQLKIILSKICFLECFLEWICLFLFHWPNYDSRALYNIKS